MLWLRSVGYRQGPVCRGTLSAYVTDDTAPAITVPAPINVTATSAAGAVVTFSVSATDPDGTATVSCTLSSGSTFPIGTTTVHCAANDAAGNSSAASFAVTVAPDTTPPTITVPDTQFGAATSSTCSASTAATTTNTGHTALHVLPPNGPDPTPLNAPAHPRRRDLLGGLIHEYDAA